MKLAHVLTRGDVLGGAQTHVRELAMELLRLGHDVTVITGVAGVFTCQLGRAGIPCIQLRSLVRPVRPDRDLAALFELCSVLGRLKPDLVCAHTAKAGWLARAAARMLHLPSVFTPHGWSIFDRASLRLRPLYWCAERLAGRLGTRVINVCEYERDMAVRFHVCPASTLDVVPNGIADVSLSRTRRIDEKPALLVMVARFESQKDHSTLLQALAGLLWMDWRLILVGDGELKEDVAGQIDTLGLRDRIDILPGDHDVNRLLLDAQIFVLSTNFEALPISILEAMRAGLPVVATHVGGVAEVVRHEETGLLVEHRDVEGLRAALARLISQPALRDRLGSAGYRLWAAEFTASAMAARTLAVYERALGQTKKGLRPIGFQSRERGNANMGHPSPG